MFLAPNAAHLWWLRTDRDPAAGVLERCAALLSPEEKERESRLVFQPDRLRYRLSHAMLRQTLSFYAPIAPQDWIFETGEYGKPFIAAGQPQIAFNLTHTKGLSACLIAQSGDVGVDAENVTRPTDFLDLASRYFSPRETARIARMPEDWRADGFFAIWTLKEAYIKARGLGLQIPLADFSFSFPEGGVSVEFAPQLKDDPADWQFQRLEPTPQHRVAVAVRQPRSLPLELIEREVEL